MLYNIYTLSSNVEPNNIRYVGVTVNNLQIRFAQHKYNALHNKSTKVSKWMYKNLKNNNQILIRLLETVEEDVWSLTEKYWISQFKTWGFSLLNIQEGGEGVMLKNRRNVTGLQASIDAHKISVVQLDKKLNLIKIYNSITEAAESLSIKHHTSISNILNKKRRTAYGYSWVTLDYYNSENYKNYTNKKTFERCYSNKYYCYNKTKKLIQIFPTKASVLNKMLKNARSNGDGLDNAVKNKTLWHNYYWSMCLTDLKEAKNSSNTILLKSLRTNKTCKILKNYKEAKEFLNLNAKQLKNCLQNKTPVLKVYYITK
jgi:hypothetical protein